MQGSILNYRVPSLWPNYIGERRATFAKAYGRKVRCYWELFGEHVRNLGALSFNPLPQKACMDSRLSPVQVESEQWTVHSPHQTQLDNKKKTPSPPTKKRVAPSLHDMTSQCLYGNSCSKFGFHYFWFGLLEVIMQQNDPHNRHP